MKPKKITFIVNPTSGVKKKKKIIQLIKNCFSSDFDIDIQHTEAPGHATTLAKNAKTEGAAIVVAIGGDGTVNEVGQALIYSDTALGLIPAGSGNGFARHLGIPLQATAAIERIKKGKLRTIDTARLNDVPFLATAGLGFDAKVGWEFDQFGKRGFLAYLQLSAKEFFKYKVQEYQLQIDDKEVKTSAFLINFANAGQYGNNAWIAPSASLSDGKLNVGILKPFPPQHAPGIIFQLFNKQIEKSKYYDLYQAKRIKIKNPMRFHMDGEAKESKTDILIKVVPKSLKVVV